jgi:hypothetical protein
MGTPKLYIKVVDGLPVDHPALEDNLLDAFGGSIPPEWEPFIRVPDPTIANNRIVLTYPQPVYKKVDGVWQDFWYYRDKTPEELEELYRPHKELWASRPYANNFTAWVFNEAELCYEPPFPRPEDHGQDGKFYRWCGAENNWKLTQPTPIGGGYYFDFNAWTYVKVNHV